MSKHKYQKRVDATVAAMLEAAAAHASAIEHRNAVADHRDELVRIESKIGEHQAEDLVRVARVEGSTAADARDIDAGDADAIACDPARFLAQLRANEETEARLLRELADAKARGPKLIADTRAAVQRVTRRREPEGLPGPVISNALGSSDVMRSLEQIVAHGLKPKSNADKLQPLYKRRKEIRIAREQAEREREAAAKDAAQFEAHRAEAKAERAEDDRKKAAAEEAKLRAKFEADDALERSFLDRVRGAVGL